MQGRKVYTHLELSSWCSLVYLLLLHYRLTVHTSCYTKLSVQSFSRLLTFLLQKNFSHSVVIQPFLNEGNSICEISSFLTIYAPFLHYYLWSHCQDSSSYWGLIPPFLQKLFFQTSAIMYSEKILHCKSSTKCFLCVENRKSLILHTFRWNSLFFTIFTEDRPHWNVIAVGTITDHITF